MQVKEVMTPKVEIIDPEITLKKAAEMMKSLNVNVLHIRENNHLIGTVSDNDIVVKAVAQGKDLNKSTVRESMTPNVLYCFEDEDIQQAAQLMKNQNVRKLTIVNRDQEVVGICSLGDVALQNDMASLTGEAVRNF